LGATSRSSPWAIAEIKSQCPEMLREMTSSLCGAAVILGFSTLRGSNAESPHHVYELRLYHVNEGEMDALKARFANYVGTIFRRAQHKEYRPVGLSP
jgi:hypothetical protein